MMKIWFGETKDILAGSSIVYHTAGFGTMLEFQILIDNEPKEMELDWKTNVFHCFRIRNAYLQDKIGVERSLRAYSEAQFYTFLHKLQKKHTSWIPSPFRDF